MPVGNKPADDVHIYLGFVSGKLKHSTRFVEQGTADNAVIRIERHENRSAKFIRLVSVADLKAANIAASEVHNWHLWEVGPKPRKTKDGPLHRFAMPQTEGMASARGT